MFSRSSWITQLNKVQTVSQKSYDTQRVSQPSPAALHCTVYGLDRCRGLSFRPPHSPNPHRFLFCWRQTPPALPAKSVGSVLMARVRQLNSCRDESQLQGSALSFLISPSLKDADKTSPLYKFSNGSLDINFPSKKAHKFRTLLSQLSPVMFSFPRLFLKARGRGIFSSLP